MVTHEELRKYFKDKYSKLIRCKLHKGFVLLNCDLGAEEYVVEELNNIPEVTNAYVTFGAYDVVAIVNADTQEAFEETVSIKVRKLSRVLSTMTLNVINS